MRLEAELLHDPRNQRDAFQLGKPLADAHTLAHAKRLESAERQLLGDASTQAENPQSSLGN